MTLTKFASLISCALLPSLAVSGQGIVEKDSLFGAIKYGDDEKFLEQKAPTPAGGYELTSKYGDASEYVANHPKGGMFLMENTLHNCKKTLYVAVDKLRGPEIESRLTTAALRRELAVRVLVTTQNDPNSFAALQRMLRLGIEVRETNAPILDPYVICDERSVVRGTLEPYDEGRMSYGLSKTSVTYNDPLLAKNYQISWHDAWGKSAPLKMSIEDNRDWELFGKNIIQQNGAVVDYNREKIIKGYHPEDKPKKYFWEVPFGSKTKPVGIYQGAHNVDATDNTRN